ncbi:MAG: hypothetical protein VKK59_01225 [Vampirovibrionales bacterium]|nr:hypothetical protein [Vampirovibrionales bacterium]
MVIKALQGPLNRWNANIAKNTNPDSYFTAVQKGNNFLEGFLLQSPTFVKNNAWAGNNIASKFANFLKPFATKPSMLTLSHPLTGGAMAAFAAGLAISAWNIGKALITQGPAEALKETARSGGGLAGGLLGAGAFVALTGVAMATPVGWIGAGLTYLIGSGIGHRIAEGIVGKNPESLTPQQRQMMQAQQAQRQQNPESINSLYQTPFNGFSLMSPPAQPQANGGIWPFPGHSGGNPALNGLNGNPWATNPFLASYPGASRLAGF